MNAVVKSWLSKESTETRVATEKLINEYFFKAFNWIIEKDDFVVETTLVGTVLNGLSHLHGVHNRSLFALGLIRGLGGNLSEGTKEAFAREVRFRCSASFLIHHDGNEYNCVVFPRSSN